MDWVPQQEGLQQLLQLLHGSISSDNAVQTAVQEQLKSFNAIPDYNNYLIYILSQMPQEDVSIRAIAGLVLKNNIRTHYEQIQPVILEYVKQHCLQSISDTDPMVRSTAGIVVTTVVARGGLTAWPQVLPKLMELLDSPQVEAVEGAFSALEKICEDSTRELEDNIQGFQPSSVMVPKFIGFLGNENSKLRVYALLCLKQFTFIHSTALFAHVDEYLSALFMLATDSHSDVRKNVCHTLVTLLEVRPDTLSPHINNIVDYMLHSTQEEDEAVALEACEFWLSFAEQAMLRDQLLPYLPRVIPVLLKCMVYSDMDIMNLLDEEDSNVPDREEDVKPRHYHAKQHEHAQAGGDANNRTNGQAENAPNQDDIDNDDEDDDDYDDDDEDDEDMMGEWNLRKCSAAAIDIMSNVFENEILEVLLPPIKEKIYSQDWKERESGILALGAIAEGCIEGMYEHLPTVIPFLLQALNDTNPLVRSITCWTLSRYSEWIVSIQDQTERHNLVGAVVEGLMRMMLDNNKRVQGAGCSALATFEEEATEELIPFLEAIIRNFAFAFSKYQRKNLLTLLDAIGTLADSVGSKLNRPEFIEGLMPLILKKWQTLPDDDRDLFALLESLASIAVALGAHFQPFAGPIWERSVRIIKQQLMQAQACTQDPTLEPPDKDFLIVSLDLLSGLVQGLGQLSEPFIMASDPSILTLMGMSMQDPSNEVRQSAYALLGDMTVCCFNHIKPHLQQIMPIVIQEIDPKAEHVGVCNNASWSVGEIAIRAGADIQEWINPLLERLIPLMVRNNIPRSLHENSAVAIGRLGGVNATLVAPHLATFAKSWCDALQSMQDDREKESAFRGMCQVIQVNPNGMIECFQDFCEAILVWDSPSVELNEVFGKIMHAYKGLFGAEWDNLMGRFPPQLRQLLQERYNV